jgi:hypothetical protein
LRQHLPDLADKPRAAPRKDRATIVTAARPKRRR